MDGARSSWERRSRDCFQEDQHIVTPASAAADAAPA
jgi:hypothetical protein